MIYRIEQREDLPPGLNAVMCSDGQKVIYIRPGLTRQERREAVRKVLRDQRRKLAALAFPLALASRAVVRGAQRVPWQAAMATGGAAAAGTVAVVGLHLGAPAPHSAGALPPPVRPVAARAVLAQGVARPHPGTAPGGGHPMTGHRGSSPLHAPVPAAPGPGQAHGPARVQEAVPHERATLPGARVSVHATGPSVLPQPRVSVPPLAVPPLAVPPPSVVPQPQPTLTVPPVTIPPVPPVPVPHVTPTVPVPTVPPLPVPHSRPAMARRYQDGSREPRYSDGGKTEDRFVTVRVRHTGS